MLEIVYNYLFFHFITKVGECMALTPKQEHFCRLVASGKDYTTAYLTAYDWNGSNSGAAVEAIKLVNREDIQEKLKALMKPQEIAIQRDSINARQKQIDFIQSRIEHCLTTGDEQSIIRYTDMLNKAFSLYKDNEQTADKEDNVNNLDISVLQRITSVS